MAYLRLLLAVLLIFILLGIARLVNLLLPFKRSLALFRVSAASHNSAPSERQIRRAWRIGYLCAKVARYTPWQAKCLVQGMVCRLLLYYLGIANTFYIGVATNSEGKLISHAWIRVAQLVILGGAMSDEEFTVIAQFE